RSGDSCEDGRKPQPENRNGHEDFKKSETLRSHSDPSFSPTWPGSGPNVIEVFLPLLFSRTNCWENTICPVERNTAPPGFLGETSTDAGISISLRVDPFRNRTRR